VPTLLHGTILADALKHAAPKKLPVPNLSVYGRDGLAGGDLSAATHDENVQTSRVPPKMAKLRAIVLDPNNGHLIRWRVKLFVRGDFQNFDSVIAIF
jgi:hypothetical protein